MNDNKRKPAKQRMGQQRMMPAVPPLDFVGALAELWHPISYSAYHMAYVRVYSQSQALRVPIKTIHLQDQDIREHSQTDLVICRAHLAAFFWHLEHLFEALRAAVTRGRQEQPDNPYFTEYSAFLESLEEQPLRREIRDYRNTGHQNPAIIGIAWTAEHQFLHHFLPTIAGHTPQEELELNMRLQRYFEYAASIWLNFAPSDLKDRFPRDFSFPVTIPFLYSGARPPGLADAPQLLVHIQSSSHATG